MKSESLDRNGGLSPCSGGCCEKPSLPTSRPASNPLTSGLEILGKRADVAKEAAPVTSAVREATPADITSLPPPVARAEAEAPTSPPLPSQPFSAFSNLGQFKDAQRMATLLARSSIVPETFRGDEHIGDCVIALEIANRIGASILAVMQNLQLVRGKLGWSSQFLISCVNASKRFSPLRNQMTGTRGQDSWGCIAWAHDLTGERLQSPEVTLRLAKQEGWYYRPGSKWRAMQELMLRYRSATLFTRLYAPELTMGLQTTEEVVEMSAEDNLPVTRPRFETELSKQQVTPKSNPEMQVDLSRQSEASSASNDPTIQTGSGPDPAVSQESPAMKPIVPTGHYHYLKALRGLIGLSPHSEADVLTYLIKVRGCGESLASLAELAQKHPESMVWTHDHWSQVEHELAQLRKGQTP